MRNILEHPMTTEEAIRILSKIKDDILREESFGDIRPYAIQWTIDQLSGDA